jgi:hypothetical protein
LRGEITIEINVSAHADCKGPDGAGDLTLVEVQGGEVGYHVTDPTDEEHNGELFRVGLVDHKQAKCETGNLPPVSVS